MTQLSTAIKQKHTGKETDNGSREKILKAAEELFIEHGFDGVSINDVAVSSGVAKSLVFYYFNSKKELFDTVLDLYYQAQGKSLMSALGAGGSIRERIHAGINAYLDFLENNRGYPRLIQREICSGRGNIEKPLQYMAPMHQWGVSLFGKSFPETGPLSAHHFFVTFFGMAINYFTYSPILEKLWGKDPMDPTLLAERREHLHKVVDALVDEFMDGANNRRRKE